MTKLDELVGDETRRDEEREKQKKYALRFVCTGRLHGG